MEEDEEQMLAAAIELSLRGGSAEAAPPAPTTTDSPTESAATALHPEPRQLQEATREGDSVGPQPRASFLLNWYYEYFSSINI